MTDPIDLRVGQRLRARRIYLGMNQGDLAALLGLTFQQMQKYEHGTNRISAGRLHYIAQLLEVPVAWFFQAGDEAMDREELALLGSYDQLDPVLAEPFLALVQAAAGATP